MRPRSPAVLAPILILAATLAACGGGGSGADVRPGQEPPPPTAFEPQGFLLFPNPVVQPDGSLQTNTSEYAEAYYRAIDPLNEKDTLAKWKAANGFETGTGTEHNVIFGDRRDLGYGRRMHARRNADGTLAFYVENYLIEAGEAYAYSPLNLDAAIVRDTRWMVGINAIEFSPGPDGGAAFPKFYNFNKDGARQLFVDLDGRGAKAMPGPCISCHGGRGDPLTAPDAAGRRHFNLVQNGVSLHRGDVQARMHPFEPDAFDFTTTRAGWFRPEQEAKIKDINRWILCTYPIASASGLPEDACRREAGASEWEGPAAELIKSSYGGEGLPAATFDDQFVPLSWQAAGQSTLYREVIATSCRTCHIMRGTSAQSDIDFTSFEKFAGYADRVKVHVFDRGNMPLAKIVYDAFWGDPNRPRLLADYLQSRGYTVRDASGAILRPGRPIADPGPDRVALPGAIPLSAANSLFSTGYAWSLVSGPAGATLAGATAAQATLNASEPGTYVVRLVASNGPQQSAPVDVRVVVQAGLAPAPAAIRFADIKAAMQATGSCVQCHSPAGTLPRPPVFYSNEDRNGDGMVDATDDHWLYEEVRGRINFTELGASPLLRKPSNNHHGGNLVAGFDTRAAPGDATRARYDLFLNWILNGAPE